MEGDQLAVVDPSYYETSLVGVEPSELGGLPSSYALHLVCSLDGSAQVFWGCQCPFVESSFFAVILAIGKNDHITATVLTIYFTNGHSTIFPRNPRWSAVCIFDNFLDPVSSPLFQK